MIKITSILVVLLALISCSGPAVGELPVSDGGSVSAGIDPGVIAEATTLYYLVSQADTAEERDAFTDEALALLEANSAFAAVIPSEAGVQLADRLLEDNPRLEPARRTIEGMATYVFRDRERESVLTEALVLYTQVQAGMENYGPVIAFLETVEAFDDVEPHPIGRALALQFLSNRPELMEYQDVVVAIASYAFQVRDS